MLKSAFLLPLAFGLTLALLYSKEQRAEDFVSDVQSVLVYAEKEKVLDAFIAKEGPRAAQEMLARLPPSADTHQLAHRIGEMLFKKHGEAGIAHCAPRLAGGCYHGFMIAAVTEGDSDELRSMHAACAEALQGGQPADCAHAMGHGFLAWKGHAELPQALDLCTAIFSESEFNEECFRGVFMQNNFQNSNPLPANRWYRQNDPMYPCRENQITERRASDACWSMQSMLTIQDDSYPQFGRSVPRVWKYCKALPRFEDAVTCLRGIAHQLQDLYDDPARIRDECGTLDRQSARWCFYFAAQTAYYFGERDAHSWPVIMCDAEESSTREECELSVFTGIMWAFAGERQRLEACADLPLSFDRAHCRSLVLNPTLLHTRLNEIMKKYAAGTDY